MPKDPERRLFGRIRLVVEGIYNSYEDGLRCSGGPDDARRRKGSATVPRIAKTQRFVLLHDLSV
jgi:hypothetical protein